MNIDTPIQNKPWFTSKTVSGILVSAVLCTLVNMVAHAQEPPPIRDPLLSGPVQIVSSAEFDQMVQSGQAKIVSPAVVEDQYLQGLITEWNNWVVVERFIDQNPNLTNLAQVVTDTPTDPDVFPTVDGNYRFVVNIGGFSQVLETMGQGTKLAILARSIQTWSDPAQQLALYRILYSQYGTLYSQFCVGAPPSAACVNLPPPSALTNPSALQNASLDVIHNAIQLITSQGPNLVELSPSVPDVDPSDPPACNAEVGFSLILDIYPSPNFGDMTNSTGCKAATPSSTGILKNVKWLNKSNLTCVRNQGARGACHIFAATSAVEELIAKQSGAYANLSEQDFMENEKLIWGPAYYGDGGDSYTDLTHAATFSYNFAYEEQWDYNPSYDQPSPPAFEYENSCAFYPFPPFAPYSTGEPGCSTSAPQAPGYCYYKTNTKGVIVSEVCALAPAPVLGESAYSVPTGWTISLWNPSPSDLVTNIQTALALGNGVMLAFNVSDNFYDYNSTGYVAYDPSCDLNKNWKKNPACKYGGFVGGHEVHVVGYISNSDLAKILPGVPGGAGGGYFIIKNSWGACYGDAGYAYMPVAYLQATATGATALFFVNAPS